MIFTETEITGLFVIELEHLQDDRGFFARSFCREEFSAHGLDPHVEQCNVSFNKHKGGLRGLHFQRHPYEESKLVRCTSGALFDVVVDVRKNSPTFGQTFSTELSQQNRRMLFLPEGMAHGYQTLADNTEVFYQMSRAYQPNSSSGIHYADPALGIAWPAPPQYLSENDQNWPILADADI